MTPRQRGAVWLLGLLCLGRLLDVFDLPFEALPAPTAERAGSSARPADSVAAVPGPEIPERRQLSGAAADSAGAAVAVAINRASAAELQALPRVGPVLAARIVAHREAHGPFRSSTDLQRVPGIGARTAARLAPLLRFD